MRYVSCTSLRKVQRHSQRNSICYRCILEISTYGPLKDKEPTFCCLLVSIHIWWPKYSRRKRRPIWVRTYNSKEFLNKHFQDMLRDEGLQFQVCKIQAWNVRFWNECIALFAIDSTYVLRIKVPTETSMFSLHLSGPKVTRFSRRLA